MAWPGVIAAYRPFLPVSAETPIVTLLEGNTPLIPVPALAHRMGLDCELYLKYEGVNPTGSFKDRGMTVAISKALETGAEAVVCASTGNTSASAAAYAARAGLKAYVLVPAGAIARGKLSQALVHGATVVAIQGSFDQALQLVRELAGRYPIALVNSVNPHRLEGQKTAAFEIVDVLGDAPDILALPVGNAGNITAYWRGFCEYYARGRASQRPRLWGFQAEGAAPLVLGQPVSEPKTIATAIRIGRPASWQGAVAARDESGGLIDMVSDEEILMAYRWLAGEGIFCEPASATAVAGVAKQVRLGKVPKDVQRIVCVVTGHGLKDPDCAFVNGQQPIEVPATLSALERVMNI